MRGIVVVLFSLLLYACSISPILSQSGVLTLKIIVTVCSQKIQVYFDLKDNLGRLMEPEVKCQM